MKNCIAATAIALCMAAVLSGCSKPLQPVANQLSLATEPKSPDKVTAKTLPAVDEELQQLLIARRDAALAESEAYRKAVGIGTATPDMLLLPERRVLASELELSDKPADQIAAFERFLESAKASENRVEALSFAQAKGGESDKLFATRYLRLDAEIQLLRAKRKVAAK